MGHLGHLAVLNFAGSVGEQTPTCLRHRPSGHPVKWAGSPQHAGVNSAVWVFGHDWKPGRPNRVPVPCI